MKAVLDAAARRVGPGLSLADDAEAIARACHDMAVGFRRGGKLLAFGNGGGAADAGHLAVEFAHPVIMGRRALPAVSLANDAATLTGLAETAGYAGTFTAQLRLLGRPEDIAVGISVDGRRGGVRAALAEARRLGMLTIALTAEGTIEGTMTTAVDHLLSAHSDDPLIAREIQVTTYHLLWELAHVFLEEPGLLDGEAER